MIRTSDIVSVSKEKKFYVPGRDFLMMVDFSSRSVCEEGVTTPGDHEVFCLWNGQTVDGTLLPRVVVWVLLVPLTLTPEGQQECVVQGDVLLVSPT